VAVVQADGVGALEPGHAGNRVAIRHLQDSRFRIVPVRVFVAIYARFPGVFAYREELNVWSVAVIAVKTLPSGMPSFGSQNIHIPCSNRFQGVNEGLHSRQFARLTGFANLYRVNGD
jgi:hypothetical protein